MHFSPLPYIFSVLSSIHPICILLPPPAKFSEPLLVLISFRISPFLLLFICQPIIPSFSSLFFLFSLALWSRITRNTDWSTGPLACPFARSLAPLTHLLAPHCLLCSHAPLHSLICSLPRGKVIDKMAFFFCVFFHFGP